MIRRIVDSVSLLADADSENVQTELQNGGSPVERLAQNGTKITINNRSSSLAESSDLNDDDLTSFFTSYGPLKTLSSSTSCYVATKSLSQEYSAVSCDENTRPSRSPTPARTRRQSLSPGRVDPSSFSNRQLPGGGSLLQRVQRAQPLRKKEHSKAIGTTSKSSKSTKSSNQLGKAEESSSTLGKDTNTEDTGMGSQADPLTMSVERYVLPFVQDLKAIELRIPVRKIVGAQRRVLKMLVNENDLIIMSMGKIISPNEEEPVIVIRKRATLLHRQEIQWKEEQRKAAERAKLLAEEEERKRKEHEREELIRANRLHQTTSCQANFEDPPSTIGRKKARRLRRERRRQANQHPKKPKLVDGEMQTVPEDHWLCPWCLHHIAPEALCGHEVVCRAGVRLKQREKELKARLEQRNADAEAKRRQRLGLPPKKTCRKQAGADLGKIELLSGRSRSRTRHQGKLDKAKTKPTSRPRSRSASKNDPRNQTSVVTKLDAVHPNDLEGMAKVMQRVCSQTGCDQLYDAGDPSTRSGIKCPKCHLPYCDRHRPIGLHSLCPAPNEAEQFSKSGVVSTACGWDAEERRAALKSAIRERRAVLQERRQRY